MVSSCAFLNVPERPEFLGLAILAAQKLTSSQIVLTSSKVNASENALFASWKFLYYPIALFHTCQPMCTNNSESGIITIKQVAENLKVMERTI